MIWHTILNDKKTQARKAQELYQALGMPSTNDLKSIIRINLIRNNAITIEDIDMATKIYGPNISMLKGKTTRRKHPQEQNDSINLPYELLRPDKIGKITLVIDTMKTNGCFF